MKVIHAPFKFTPLRKLALFLSGSIEQGTAKQWQKELISHLNGEDIIVLNPRRDDWDSTWKQDISNRQFREQVEWELEGLEKADVIAMYFDKDTKSPITLLEFGLYAQTGKMIVCCPKGFWRKGNVDVVCEKYNIKQVENLEQLAEEIRNAL